MKRKVLPFLLSISVLAGSFINQSSYAQDSVANDTTSSFTIVILPDTQYYSESYPEIFMSQTRWIKEYAQELNIKIVLHEGDITNTNTASEWIVAQRSMRVLDGTIPYVMSVGNHDMGKNGRADTRDTRLFNRYFPQSRYESSENFGGVFEEGKLDNAFYLFTAGNKKWLVLTLEFRPRNNVLVWANSVVEKYSDRLVIVVTHSYLNEKNVRTSNSGLSGSQYGIINDSQGANSGQDMWKKFVSIHENILLVFNGHHGGDGTGRLVSRGENGNLVYQVFANYQGMKNGGNGFLRIIKIDTLSGEIRARTYSPYLDLYLRDSKNQFKFKYVRFLKEASECVYYESNSHSFIYNMIFFNCLGPVAF